MSTALETAPMCKRLNYSAALSGCATTKDLRNQSAWNRVAAQNTRGNRLSAIPARATLAPKRTKRRALQQWSPRDPAGNGDFRTRGVIGIALAASLLLSACATAPVKYTPVYCVSPSQLDTLKKAEPGKIGNQLTGNAQDDLKLIAGNDIQLRTYADGLLGVVGGCVGPSH